MENDKSKMYHWDELHNLFSIILSTILLISTIIISYFVISKNYGYGFLIIFISLFLFSVLKMFRSISLSINLKRKSNEIKKERVDIYVYENWHKKYVGNFWISLLFLFIWLYSFLFNLSFLYFDNQISNSIINLNNNWEFYVIYFSLLLLLLILMFANRGILRYFVFHNKEYMNRIGVTSNELKVTINSTKDDYKNFSYFIFSIFFAFIPLFFLLNKSFNEFIKSL